MGALTTRHTLTWVMDLSEEGYTTFELRDTGGVRWGWIVNAGGWGWTTHVGDFGQADTLGYDSPPLEQEVTTIEKIGKAKAWVEQKVADGWKEYVTWGDQRKGARP